MNYKWRKQGWRVYRDAHRLLDAYPDRRRDHAHDPKTPHDRKLEALKIAFIAGCDYHTLTRNGTQQFRQLVCLG